MNAIANLQERDEKRKLRKLRKAAAHEPCLYTFTCKEAPTSDDEPVSDNRLRLKGFLSFVDAFVDPLAGTEYMICSGPLSSRSTADYFEQVGKHMSVVMYTPGGRLVAGPERRSVKRG